ncbi:MAG: hypothetical protein KA247_09545 [Bacteroidetes bacterium]|nr:hypothetical protein [Bacteroidota bacterium]
MNDAAKKVESNIHPLPSVTLPKTAIEDKVANILAYTQRYGEAAATRNDEEKINTLLRFAQHFAEDGNVESAMMQLQRAYAINPLHPGISALERLLRQTRDGASSANGPDPTPLDASRQTDDAWTGFDRRRYADRIGVGKEPVEIQECLARAEYLREKHDLMSAKTMVHRAYQIDPFNASIARIERSIDAQAPMQESEIDRIIRDAKTQLSQNNFETARVFVKQAYALDPFNEKIQQIDETITLSLKKELNPAEHCLLAAHRYFHAGEYQKAKEEIYLGYLIDPLNQQIASLEEKVDKAMNP